MSKIDPRELRRSLGTFATGVTIITTIDGTGEPRGFTANSFTSVSLDPPLVLVCIAKEAGSLDAFETAQSYAVNILSEKQRDLSTLFASRGENRYADVNWTKKTTGSPILNGTAAWLDCTMEQTIDAGDHIILMGKVVAHEHNAEPILGYCRGAYVSLGLAQQAMEIAEQDSRVRVGGIIEIDGQLLFKRVGNQLQLPGASRVGTVDEPRSLIGELHSNGINFKPDSLYSVYDDGSTHVIYYRGEGIIQSSAMGDYCLQSIQKIDVTSFSDKAVASMLGRYIEESHADVFGIYIGNHKNGAVHASK